MKLVDNKFYFTNEIGYKLFHNVAKHLPIFDFHCHLNAKDIVEDKPFNNIAEIWLYGDHYKWRLMRFHGIEEKYITGNESDLNKFVKYAQTIEFAFNNPLYYWSNMELTKYFNINQVLTSDNAIEIYNTVNQYITTNKISPKKLINDSNVDLICTTDSPYDDLVWHQKLKEDKSFKTTVVPGYRVDDLFVIGDDKFDEFIKKLETKYQTKINDYSSLLNILEKALIEFKELGSSISDHGFNLLPYCETSFENASNIYQLYLNKNPIDNKQKDQFVTQILIDLAGLYIKHNFVMQIHFGALRNNNEMMFNQIGRDTGFDVMNHQNNIAEIINSLLNAIFKKYNNTPKMIFFNLDPMITKVVAAAIVNFQINTNVKGKIQLGAAWWLNDNDSGITEQLNAFSESGVLGDFVGMLTDSRSYVSYARHDYFRRLLCNYVGRLVVQNKLPNDFEYLSKFVKKVCYLNAKEFFKQ